MTTVKMWKLMIVGGQEYNVHQRKVISFPCGGGMAAAVDLSYNTKVWYCRKDGVETIVPFEEGAMMLISMGAYRHLWDPRKKEEA